MTLASELQPSLSDSALTNDVLPPLRTSSAQVLLQKLLTASIVRVRDWESLTAKKQDELQHHADGKRLIDQLIELKLLTGYQAERIAAGTTFGLILGNYRVLERLGTGGMGVVFKAEHVDMRRQVAIKVLSTFADQDSRIQQRFLTEIRVVAQLQHPNIVAAMDSGTTSGPDSPGWLLFTMGVVRSGSGGASRR